MWLLGLSSWPLIQFCLKTATFCEKINDCRWTQHILALSVKQLTLCFVGQTGLTHTAKVDRLLLVKCLVGLMPPSLSVKVILVSQMSCRSKMLSVKRHRTKIFRGASSITCLSRASATKIKKSFMTLAPVNSGLSETCWAETFFKK